jgi:hypothetical protein
MTGLYVGGGVGLLGGGGGGRRGGGVGWADFEGAVVADADDLDQFIVGIVPEPACGEVIVEIHLCKLGGHGVAGEV